MLFAILHKLPRMAEVRGFPGYYATDDGRVFSTRLTGLQKRDAPQRRRLAWLAQNPHPRTGHLRVTMFRADGKQVSVGVHRAIALAFLGDPPSNAPEVCHRDGDPKNNALWNLRWDSTSGNACDREAHKRDREARRREFEMDREQEEGQLDRWWSEQGLAAYTPDPEFGF